MSWIGDALAAVGHALAVAGSMTWQITWSLILGFTLSAVVQALVRRETIANLLGGRGPAAVALARSLFQKGASFIAAMAFEIASTNLVIELGIKFSIPSPAEIPCRIGHPKRRLTFQATAGDTSQHPHL